MKKIAEVNAVRVLDETGVNLNLLSIRKNKRWQFDEDWIEAAFTPAQKKLFEGKRLVLRPHPRHNPTIEVFLDESEITDVDEMMIALIFQKRI